LYRHGKISIELRRESWLERGCRYMGVSVDPDLYRPSRIYDGGKEGSLVFNSPGMYVWMGKQMQIINRRECVSDGIVTLNRGEGKMMAQKQTS
jgi:hypothetical protein